jgi:hypothetical protein
MKAREVETTAIAAILEDKLEVSSHLEEKDGVIDIVGNHSGKRRVATGDEIQLHLVTGALIQALDDVLGGRGVVMEMVVRARARALLAQFKAK